MDVIPSPLERLSASLAQHDARAARKARERRRAAERAVQRLQRVVSPEWDEYAAELERQEAEARLGRTLRRAAGATRSGWRHGTPQCDGCRRILSGYGQSCPDCGGYSRPRDGARGGRAA